MDPDRVPGEDGAPRNFPRLRRAGAGVPDVVLASGSPRRRELLDRLGLAYDVQPADLDESPREGEDPVAYVERLACEKATAVERLRRAAGGGNVLVIAADTTVELDGTILGKPEDPADARRILRLLSARTHRVHTGVAVRAGDRVERGVATTLVRFAPLSDADVEWYLATGEPFDKAGAYAIQGAGGVFVEAVTGSVSNVVGLPLTLLARLVGRIAPGLLPGADAHGR